MEIFEANLVLKKTRKTIWDEPLSESMHKQKLCWKKEIICVLRKGTQEEKIEQVEKETKPNQEAMLFTQTFY